MTEAVAIIGMSLRLPGANTVEEFWANVSGGRDCLTRFDEEQLLAAGVRAEELGHPGYVPVRGIIDHVESFDADLFGMSPREAQITDPQQRVFLECALEALECAGYATSEAHGRIGVYAGTGSNMYLLRHVLSRPDLVTAMGEMALLVASEKDHVATRTANRLGLQGPAITMQTSCSTSLVAVHMAAQSLLRHEADVMLAGGVSIHLPQVSGYLYHEHDIMSPDGRCRAFDRDAQGTVPGNGAGIVVLKRVSEAVRDGDTIYAVVTGSAVNNDGGRKVGYTAPSVTGQAEVIRAAHAAAGISPATVRYVETHGTGTEIGDGIEIAALTEAFAGVDLPGHCALGSLKPNIGHVDSAAGIAGLIKATLALWHGQMPPSIHHTEANPDLKLDNGPFFVNRELRAWPDQAEPLRCGVSAFGLGGTNAHLVLQEAPRAEPEQEPQGEPVVLPLSARTPTAARAMIRELCDQLTGREDIDVRNAAYTLQRGRRKMAYRTAAVVCGGTDLSSPMAFPTPVKSRTRVSVGLLFPGQGSQFPGMAADVYDRYPVARDAIDECAALLRPELGVDIRWLLCEPAASETNSAGLEGMRLGQASMFVVEFATATLLLSWGLRPSVLLGHSLGEYAAACVAGAMTLADAVRLVAARGKILETVRGGAMLSVRADEATVGDLLPAELSFAAVNHARSVVVTGPTAAVDALVLRLDARHIEHRRVPVPLPAHSPLLDPVLAEFEAVANQFDYRPPTIPCVSSMTGKLIDRDGGFSATYWTQHLRRTVRFADAAEKLVQLRHPVLIEVGPGNVLTSFVRAVAGDRPVSVFSAVPGRHDDLSADRAALESIAGAWCAGAEVDWDAPGLRPAGRRIPLATYPFERQRHWLEPVTSPEGPAAPLPVAGPGPQEAGEVVVVLDDAVIQRIVEIWREILGVDEIVPDSNFFALGGQSMTVVRMISRIKETLGVTLPMRVVVAAPTVRALTEAVTLGLTDRDTS